MDDWLKQLQEDIHKNINSVARGSSDWFAAASKEAEQVVELIEQTSVETVEEIQMAIAPVAREVNHQFANGLEASFVFIEQQVTPWVVETTAPITKTVTPWIQNHPTCISCKNYHGTAYGESMLVCGMHPYGPDDTNCADWESVWTEESDAA